VKKYILAHPWLFSLSIVFGAVANGVSVLTALMYMHIIDAITDGNGDALLSLVIMAVLILLLHWVSYTIAPRIADAYRVKTTRTLKNDVFSSVLCTKIADFNKENSAKYISAINNDIGTIESNYFSAISDIVKTLSLVILSIAGIAMINPLFALIVVAIAPITFISPWLYSRKMSDTQVALSVSAVSLNQKIKDFLTGFEVIKTFGVEKKIQSRFFKSATHLMSAEYKAQSVLTDMTALTVVLLDVASFSKYFIAGFLVLRGNITVGAVVGLVSLAGGVQMPLKFISEFVGKVKSSKGVRERVLDIMRQADTMPKHARINTIEGDITLADLSFSYEKEVPQGESQRAYALKNICYNFKKNGKYAIVGQSGSGKSTLAKLMMGYYDNYDGNILISNHNIKDINREDLYSLMSILHQNVFLLDDTLKNNITLYKSYTNDAYRSALKTANLLDVEGRLLYGSNTILGEGGNTLSGGERQRVSIARSILKGSELLIMDEATSGLDNITAHGIESSIINAKGMTCIFVTHRYSEEVLKKCDGILVMKNGELFETGTFDELYDTKGYFYSLYNVTN